jgi:hypothetical protein
MASGDPRGWERRSATIIRQHARRLERNFGRFHGSRGASTRAARECSWWWGRLLCMPCREGPGDSRGRPVLRPAPRERRLWALSKFADGPFNLGRLFGWFVVPRQ